ncbi:oxidoreductase [Sphingomonas sp. NIBR02145]|uniref:oxidoreductase n=1 Tax=Sphingomonas sp. NIBR02145 TaxID=3014784 RepID=UPI0022B463DA|nr:oxidoreductase [Sphingomonas sp. NIBR02145]WHU04163.1 oxidoreductase [Sphingomonas sp. NIBR02145]
MIRTGVIGYGLGGLAFHAPLVDAVPELELAAIATSRADQVHERYPDVAVTNADALLADPSIELVVVTTPNDTHVPLARRALEAGKHVVIDKPFATNVADGEALVALAREKGLIASAFHNRRWDGDFLTVRKLLDSGVLGEVILAELRWDRFRPALAQAWKEDPEAGAGILADLGPHLIDQALQLFGRPEAVYGDIAVQREGGRTDDYFEITLFYGERRVTLSAGRLFVTPRPRFWLHGTKADFAKHGLDPQEPRVKDGACYTDPGVGDEEARFHGTLTRADGSSEIVPTEAGDYRGFYAGIARAIATGGPAPVPGEDAVLGLRVAELARESAREGRRLSL